VKTRFQKRVVENAFLNAFQKVYFYKGVVKKRVTEKNARNTFPKRVF
jgi:hypothetical protein